MSKNLCPKVEASLNLLSTKWVGLIIFSLINGPMKFSGLEHFIPKISPRLLNERLKYLSSEGIIKKHIFNETPIRIQYELTRKGIDLQKTFMNISLWAEKWN